MKMLTQEQFGKLTRRQIEKMPAGRELDAMIAEHVLGLSDVMLYSDGECRFREVPSLLFVDAPRYSTDIAGAWQVVLKFCCGGSVEVREVGPYRGNDDGHAVCEIKHCDDDESEAVTWEAWADTAPLAICRAALLAKLSGSA